MVMVVVVVGVTCPEYMSIIVCVAGDYSSISSGIPGATVGADMPIRPVRHVAMATALPRQQHAIANTMTEGLGFS